MPAWRQLLLAALLALSAAMAAPKASASDEPGAFARVTVSSAEVRAGPSVTSRVIHAARRGEAFAVDGRSGRGFWLRVLLPDGRVGYASGDAVQVFAVHPGEPGAPSRPGLFATRPLEGARAGFAILGGVLAIPSRAGTTGAFGYLEGRPSLVLHRRVTLDGFIGDAPTADGAHILYGAGITVYLAPSWAVSPLLSVGGGGLYVRPNASALAPTREDLYVARAGGGLAVALRGRFIVRFEVTNVTLFGEERVRHAQTYAGGLGVYF